MGVTTWTAVEPCVGVIGACIPSLRPLLAFLLGTPFNKSAKGRKKSPSAMSGSYVIGNKTDEEDLIPLSRLKDHSQITQIQHPWKSHTAMIHSCMPNNTRKDSGNQCFVQVVEHEEPEPPPKSGIRVKTVITLSISERVDYNDRLF